MALDHAEPIVSGQPGLRPTIQVPDLALAPTAVGGAPRYPACAGEVAERLKAALLKSVELQDSVGSNPTLSASA